MDFTIFYAKLIRKLCISKDLSRAFFKDFPLGTTLLKGIITIIISLTGITFAHMNRLGGPVHMGRSYPGWRENISTSQIILFCSYGETLSRLPGKVSGCDVALNIN
jgi:hypothetical protein